MRAILGVNIRNRMSNVAFKNTNIITKQVQKEVTLVRTRFETQDPKKSMCHERTSPGLP